MEWGGDRVTGGNGGVWDVGQDEVPLKADVMSRSVHETGAREKAGQWSPGVELITRTL